MNIKFLRIFSKMRYHLSTGRNNKVKVQQMAHAGISGSKGRRVMRSGEFIDQDPDFDTMTDEEICAFFEALEPDVTDEELEAIDRRVYPKIIARIEQANQDKEAKRRRIRRKGLVAAVICSLFAVSAIAQALGLPIWDSVIQWTEEHFIMQFFPSQSAAMVMDISQENIPAAVYETWGDEVCDALMELDNIPDLPTWKPEGFQFETVDMFSIPGVGLTFSAVYYDDAGNVLSLTIEELSAQDPDYNIEFERNVRSGKIEEHDGVQYYYMENMDRYMVIWHQDGIALNISGDFSEQDARRMVESI